MPRPNLMRLDPRLVRELAPRRRTITLGVLCVVVAGALDALAIPLLNGAISSIQATAPKSVADRSARDQRRVELRTTAQKLASESLTEDRVLEVLVDADQRARDASTVDMARDVGTRLGLSPDRVRTVLDSERPKPSGDPSALYDLLKYSGLMVLLFTFKYWFTRGQTFYLTKASSLLAMNLRQRVFSHLQRLPISYFGANRAGAIQSVLNNDVNVVAGAVQVIRDSLSAPITGLLSFAFVLYYQWQLAAAVLLFLPLMTWAIQRNAKKMRRAQTEVQEDLASAAAFTSEAVAGSRVVRAFAAEDRLDALHRERLDKSLASQLAAAHRQASLKPLVELMGATALAVVIVLAGYLSFRGQADLGSIVAVVFALDRVNQSFRTFSNVSNTYASVMAAMDRIYDLVLDVPVQKDDDIKGLMPAQPKGRIEFQNVTFRYPDGTEALRDVSFTLEPGTSLALVGPSGAGKSTVADLLLRFHDPTEGRILFDGADLRDLDLAWLRAQIGVVPQQTFLFAGSVADNLRLGAPSAAIEEIEDAARRAHAEEFVARLPARYDAEVGEGGNRLSGGQRQRLAIARALVRKPTVLLLDEATSALDAESEKAVTEALDEVMRERTTLFIAHRLTTAARADRIAVMSRGQVVETGSHAELLASGGAYAGLFRAFAGGVLS